MHTIAYDESGSFEKTYDKDSEQNLLIAGIIINDKENLSYASEVKKHIYSNLKKAVEDADEENIVYPRALHESEKVKKLIIANVKKYLGLPKGDAEKGECLVFAILKSKEGMKSLLGSGSSVLLDDGREANLYYHMSAELLNRILFHNPKEDIKKVSLLIPQRISDTFDKETDIANEYQKMGYTAKIHRGGQNKTVHYVTLNADIIRTFLKERLIHSPKRDLELSDFKVKSIDYSRGKNDEDEVLLYWCDCLCTYLVNGLNSKTKEIQESDSSNSRLDAIGIKLGQITPKKIIIGYDDIEALYDHALRAYERGDYYEALSIIFDSKKNYSSSEFYEFYWSKYGWFMPLEKMIKEDKGPEGILDYKVAAEKLLETTKSNVLDKPKLKYIFGVLKEAIDNQTTNNKTDKDIALYNLYDAGVSAYTHFGDSEKANMYMKEIEKRAGCVGNSVFMNSRNKYVTLLTDRLDFARAEKIAKENIEFQDVLRNAFPIKLFVSDSKEKSKIEVNEINVDYGKALSQYGQVLSYKGDVESEACFKKSLSFFEEGSANYKITQSYMLHDYLNKGESEKYISGAKYYFESENIEEQLKFIIDESKKELPLVHKGFALYLFVKGIYNCRIEASETVLREIYLESREMFIYPKVLVNKYLRMLMLGRTELVEEYNIIKADMEKAEKDISSLLLIIKLMANLECAINEGRKCMSNEYVKDLKEIMKKSFDIRINSGKDEIDDLRRYLTYMYC